VSHVRFRARTTTPRTAALLSGAITTIAGAAACGLLAGCSSAPAPTPELSGFAALPGNGLGNVLGGGLGKGSGNGPGPGYEDTRITLPETVDLSFHHPQRTDRTEHEVLFTVQQALRAQLHAEYSSYTDPLLSVYWSGAALSSAQSEIATWLKKGEQPVGVLVITDTAYTAPTSAGVAAVTYCAGWSDVVTGKADTHVVGGAVQASGTPGTYTALTLSRAGGHRWQVTTLTASADSSHCSNTSD
jgi:hypothetical protein